jgi:hypothetical protein
MCNIQRDYPLSGSFTRGFAPPASQSLTVHVLAGASGVFFARPAYQSSTVPVASFPENQGPARKENVLRLSRGPTQSTAEQMEIFHLALQRKVTDKLQTRVENLMEEREKLQDRVKTLNVSLLRTLVECAYCRILNFLDKGEYCSIPDHSCCTMTLLEVRFVLIL